MELADKLLEGKYSYIVSTHIDKNHIHNHIIFCATDHINHEKYHDCKKSYYHIRELSDELYQEHNLSVITPGQNRGKKYKEWQERKEGTSWKMQLRNDIDEAIQVANSYEHFLELMEARGYEIKGADFEEDALKYISFRPMERERSIRGSDKFLGANHTKERLQERIEESLCEETHGYGIVQKIEALTDGAIRISPGTLYGSLSKMEKDELITFVWEEEKRKLYRITDLGIQVLNLEMKRIERLYRIIQEVR